jgi:hypothetical protein
VCHAFYTSASFYQQLFQFDQAIAAEVGAAGCAHCGGKLHVANYPRKPRGIRGVLDASYRHRLSFCCARDGCRRRTTPPSLRFLGRKVYLGIIVILVTAVEHGLCTAHRHSLTDALDLWPQTVARWRQWWRVSFVASGCWREARGRCATPVDIDHLPGALLESLVGQDISHRCGLLLRLLAPVTTTSWSGSVRVVIDPQKM